jgi:hypothetical protein
MAKRKKKTSKKVAQKRALTRTVSTKTRLTQREEFEIMKLVLDKFLWLGFAIMGLGAYKFYQLDYSGGLSFIIAGAIVLVLFLTLIVREYEIIS